MKKIAALLLLLVLMLGLAGCGSASPEGEYVRFYNSKAMDYFTISGNNISFTCDGITDHGTFTMNGKELVVTWDEGHHWATYPLSYDKTTEALYQNVFGRDDYYYKKHDKDAFNHSNKDVIKIAEKYVLDKLKAPATAQFGAAQDYTIKCYGNMWFVDCFVDSQNSFGAMIRTKFSMTITYSSKDNYTVDAFSMD